MANEPSFDLQAHMRRLHMQPGPLATPADLSRIEHLAGFALPAPYRTFLTTAGGARCNCILTQGPSADRDVIFFAPDQILSRLEDLSGQGLVPIADDLMGDVYYLARDGVKQFVDADQDFVDVAPSFEALLEQMEIRQ